MASLRLCGCVFSISFCRFLVLTIAQITDPSEVSALQSVKSSLIDPMKHLKNWNKGDPCTSNWTGVLCFNAIEDDGYLHVREIQLINMNLSGSLSPKLGLLSHLQILDFMWNGITGSVPKEIGYISSLKLLLLNGNKLSGSLPDELGYLANLNRLQVDLNQISGPIPKSFANLGSIKHLHLNNNSISGHIPSELSNLSTLFHLLLDNNNLSGYLPQKLAKLPNLRILQLDNNNFSGADIPGSYGNFSRLVKLSLRNCRLQGAFPDLSRIPNLSYIDLSWNYLNGSLSLNKLADNMTTIDLSDNNLSGSIPINFSYLPSLQKLSLENNILNGSVTADLWQNKFFSAAARFTIDLRNNSLSNVLGVLDPPANVTLRLEGNPVCTNSNLNNIGQFCGLEAEANDTANSLNNLTGNCPNYTCPRDNYFEYVQASPVPCFCASPLRVGYRLKSPSFSYFAPYVSPFEMYLTSSLELELYQLSIESFVWESGPRLRMYLKIFPEASVRGSTTFNWSEIQRIRERFISWDFQGSDLFGPYELLNFTLLGPYSYYANYVTQSKKISRGVVIAIVLSAIACAVAASTMLTVFIKRRPARYQRSPSRKRRPSMPSEKIDGVKSFTFKEMALATDDFSNSTQVGQGGYGIVYKGTLSDNTIVAIKRARGESLQGQKEFLTEIEMLSRLHHRNLVSLIGYCDEEGEQMLVYEFMPNGTLQDWLSGNCKESLNFGQRVQVALGSAKGILYLHTEANPPIFHRDIKASNILLDSKLTAKVADFGLSRLAPVLDDEGTIPDHVSTVVKGTPGYLDPEYFLTHKLTDKSDVYSLGVVFLEILTGLRPISQGKNIVREVNLAREWGTVFSIIDSRMGSYPAECVERFVALALRCCQDKPEDRPSMLDVVRELENLLKIMPEIEMSLPEPKSKCFGDSTSASSLFSASKEQYVSTSASGSDLVSGGFSTITPR